MASKKEFFRKRTAAQIMKGKELLYTSDRLNLAEQVERLSENEVLVITDNIIPKKYYPRESGNELLYERTFANSKFLKHGTEVKPRRSYSLEETIRNRKLPFQQRREAMEALAGYDSAQFYSGYTFRPATDTGDSRARKLSLVQCVDGAALFAYAMNNTGGFEVKNRGTIEKAKKAEKEGSTFELSVPSRREKKGRYKVIWDSVATIDSQEKYAIANRARPAHQCDYLTYKNMRYKFISDKESSDIINICAHDIAAYLGIIENQKDESFNLIPLQMSWIAIPTQYTVDMLKKARNQAVLQYKDAKGKERYAPLNQAEQEIFLWNLTHREIRNNPGHEGYDKLWFAKEKITNYRF